MKEYIKEIKTVDSAGITEEIKKYEGIVYALYTGKLTCGDEVTDPSLLLEARVFSETSEVKFSRTDIDKPFICRVIDDDYFRQQLANTDDLFEKQFENRIRDDEQYLDINLKLSTGRNYRSTGGGEYTLPFEGAEKILIRNYIDYSENGIAEITDFRIVKII